MKLKSSVSIQCSYCYIFRGFWNNIRLMMMCSPYSHINLFTMNTELLNSVHIKKRIAINIPYHSISLQFYEYWSKLLLLRILQSCGIILFSKALNRCRGRESSFDRSMEIERISEINSNEGSTYTSHKKNIWHLTMEFRSFFEVLSLYWSVLS